MKKPPNYVLKLLAMRAEGKLPNKPGLHHVILAHDDWCGVFKGKPCDCEPEFRLIEDFPEDRA